MLLPSQPVATPLLSSLSTESVRLTIMVLAKETATAKTIRSMVDSRRGSYSSEMTESLSSILLPLFTLETKIIENESPSGLDSCVFTVYLCKEIGYALSDKESPLG